MYIHKRPVLLRGALEGQSPLALWAQHLRDHWRVYSIGVVAVIGTNFTEVALPKIIQWNLDLFTETGALPDRLTRFHELGLLFLAMVLIQFVARIGWRLTMAQQTHFSSARMKSLLWDRARFLPKIRFETDLNAGELMNIGTSDVSTARFIFGFTLVGTIDFIFLLIFAVAAMLSIHVPLTFFTLVVLLLLPWALDKLARRESREHSASQAALSELTDRVAQSVASARLQRITQTGSFWIKKLRESAEAYRVKRLRVVHTSLAFIPATGSAPLVSYAVLLGVGLNLVFKNQLSIGGFVAMQSYIFLIQGPILELGVIISEWQRCFASLRRITNVYGQSEVPGLRAGGQTVKSQDPVFEVRNLSFAYPTSDRKIFNSFNLTVKAGERVGIKGNVGAGKTSLLNILSGDISGYSGAVKFFGAEVTTYAHESLTQTLAVVPQKPFLFADTVRKNLLLHHVASDEQLWRILEIACVAEDIRAIEGGLSARLGEWGINLSGGQKQRLTLARALVAKPKVLLLDDCLSAVDTVTEERILDNLNEHLAGLTTLWVAHRASTLRYCHRIVELAP